RALSSFFAQDRTERQSADQQRRKRGGRKPARDGSAAESAEEPPGHGQTIRRRVEDVLEHGDQHLREQPAEQRGQRERPREHEYRLAPEKRRRLAQRGAERRHRRELLPPLGKADGDEQR